jgi:predicted nucleic acid-binding protein
VIVVSNTSPITNLSAIGQLPLLHALYGVLYIPEAVYNELKEGEHRGDHPPFLETTSWIEVRSVPPNFRQTLPPCRLDIGEAEAIALAQLMQADILLMDEHIDRRCARLMNLRVVGVLGTLIAAKQHGLIEAVRPLMEQLQQKAGFRISERLFQEVLQQAGE